MSHPTSRRRGVMLVLVLGVAALLAGIFAVLAAFSTGQHRTHKQDELERAARLAAASAATWLQHHPDAWEAAAQAGDAGLKIDVSALMPPRATGRAVLQFNPQTEPQTGAIEVRVNRTRTSARARLTVPRKLIADS